MKIRATQLRIQRIILLAQRKAARELAKMLPGIIRQRVRDGFGVKGRLKALSDSYIGLRTRLKKYLSRETSPGDSNLTATGQMLNAIKGEANGTSVKIFISDKKRRQNPLSPGSATNKEIRKYVEDQGREFFALTTEEKNLAINFAKEMITKELRDKLKRK